MVRVDGFLAEGASVPGNPCGTAHARRCARSCDESRASQGVLFRAREGILSRLQPQVAIRRAGVRFVQWPRDRPLRSLYLLQVILTCSRRFRCRTKSPCASSRSPHLCTTPARQDRAKSTPSRLTVGRLVGGSISLKMTTYPATHTVSGERWPSRL